MIKDEVNFILYPLDYLVPFNEIPEESLQYLIDWCSSNVNYPYNDDLEKKTYFNTFMHLLDEKLRRNEIE